MTTVTAVDFELDEDEFVRSRPKSSIEIIPQTQVSQNNRDASIIEYFSSVPIIEQHREQVKHSG